MMNTDNRIEKALTKLRIPEGLEQRLSERIDELAATHRRRRRRIMLLQSASVAAAVTLILSASLALRSRPAPASEELTPEQVRYYTEMALNKAAVTVQKSGDGLRSTEQALNHITQTLQKI